MAIKTYQDSKDKYLKEKVDTFVLRVPKGKKDEIMEYAKAKGMSLNGYITSLVFADMGSKLQVKTAQKPSKAEPKAKKEPQKAPNTTSPKPQVQKHDKPKRQNMPSFLL